MNVADIAANVAVEMVRLQREVATLTRSLNEAREEVARLQGIIDTMAPDIGREVAAVRDEARAALEESVKLQSHYADLLNMYDGGERRQFANADEWIARLAELRRANK